jgi:hypothetical protein
MSGTAFIENGPFPNDERRMPIIVHRRTRMLNGKCCLQRFPAFHTVNRIRRPILR